MRDSKASNTGLAAICSFDDIAATSAVNAFVSAEDCFSDISADGKEVEVNVM